VIPPPPAAAAPEGCVCPAGGDRRAAPGSGAAPPGLPAGRGPAHPIPLIPPAPSAPTRWVRLSCKDPRCVPICGIPPAPLPQTIARFCGEVRPSRPPHPAPPERAPGGGGGWGCGAPEGGVRGADVPDVSRAQGGRRSLLVPRRRLRAPGTPGVCPAAPMRWMVPTHRVVGGPGPQTWGYGQYSRFAKKNSPISARPPMRVGGGVSESPFIRRGMPKFGAECQNSAPSGQGPRRHDPMA